MVKKISNITEILITAIDNKFFETIATDENSEFLEDITKLVISISVMLEIFLTILFLLG